MKSPLAVSSIPTRPTNPNQPVRESAPSLYEPINVYKALAPNIGVVDGPFEYLTVAGIRLPLPFTTRMTVVKLANGDLFLHSPIAFNAALAEDLRSRGVIRYLVSPNQFHYAHIGEWAKAFPDAVTWGSTQAHKRAQSRGVDVHFTSQLSETAPAEWKEDIDQTLVPGGIFKEFAFFHITSKTLILTDTIMNIELPKINQPWRFVTWLTGMHYPFGQVFFGMRLPLLLQRRRTRAAFAKIRSWRPESIVLSHGRCFDGNAAETVHRIFR
jgi:hypothetical protein